MFDITFIIIISYYSLPFTAKEYSIMASSWNDIVDTPPTAHKEEIKNVPPIVPTPVPPTVPPDVPTHVPPHAIVSDIDNIIQVLNNFNMSLQQKEEKKVEPKKEERIEIGEEMQEWIKQQHSEEEEKKQEVWKGWPKNVGQLNGKTKMKKNQNDIFVHYCQNGWCCRDSQCPYLHPRSGYTEGMGRVCRMWMSTGHCFLREQHECGFAHPNQEFLEKLSQFQEKQEQQNNHNYSCYQIEYRHHGVDHIKKCCFHHPKEGEDKECCCEHPSCKNNKN